VLCTWSCLYEAPIARGSKVHPGLYDVSGPQSVSKTEVNTPETSCINRISVHSWDI